MLRGAALVGLIATALTVWSALPAAAWATMPSRPAARGRRQAGQLCPSTAARWSIGSCVGSKANPRESRVPRTVHRGEHPNWSPDGTETSPTSRSAIDNAGGIERSIGRRRGCLHLRTSGGPDDAILPELSSTRDQPDRRRRHTPNVGLFEALGTPEGVDDPPRYSRSIADADRRRLLALARRPRPRHVSVRAPATVTTGCLSYGRARARANGEDRRTGYSPDGSEIVYARQGDDADGRGPG